MTEEESDTIKKKIDYFYKQQTYVHITTKKDRFYNGQIVEVSADFFIIHDRVLGELPVFFLEIEDVEPFDGAVK